MKRELENLVLEALETIALKNARFGRLDHASELNTERFLRETTAFEWGLGPVKRELENLVVEALETIALKTSVLED